MSGFSPSAFEASVGRIKSGLATLPGHVDSARDGVNVALKLPMMTANLQKLILDLWDQLVAGLKAVVDFLGRVLQWIAAPVLMWYRAGDFIDRTKGPLLDVSANVDPTQLLGEEKWAGTAAGAYRRRTPNQSSAAKSLGEAAGTLATQLQIAGGAGLTFYVAMGIVLFEFISTLVLSIITLPTGVFTLAGLAAICIDVAKCGIQWTALIVAIVALIGSLAQTTLACKNAVAGFPGAHWPEVVR